MPLFLLNPYQPPDGLALAIWELSESTEDLLQQLSLQEVAGVDAFASEKRRKEFLGVRLALKTLLGREISVQYDENGKPFLSDHSACISISHSGHWIAVAAHPSCSVGVDIEVPSAKIGRVAPRFLSPGELEDFSHDAAKLQLCWSAKEALYKVIGPEAVDFANQLRIFSFEVNTDGGLVAEHVPTGRQFMMQYLYRPDFALVFCLASQ